jgi:hypothetical protein
VQRAPHSQSDHVGTDESGQRGQHLAELMCWREDRLVKVAQHELLGRLVDNDVHQSRHIEDAHVPNSSANRIDERTCLCVRESWVS